VAFFCLLFLVIVFLILRPVVSNKTSSSIANCPSQNKQHPGHCVSSNLETLDLKPNQKFDYKFQIQDDQGKPLTNFDIGHEKIMHVLLIKKDRSLFFHLHPEFDEQTGTFTLKGLEIPEPGSYRLFADFKDGNIKDESAKAVAVYEDLQIGMDTTKPQAVSTKEMTKTFGSYDVIMLSQPEIVSAGTNTKLSFLISDNRKNGAPVKDLRPYLGAYGHAVIFDSDLNLIHTHSNTGPAEAANGVVEFEFTPNTAGNFAVFAQFQIGNQLITTNFGLLVNKTLSEQDQKINSGLHDGH